MRMQIPVPSTFLPERHFNTESPDFRFNQAPGEDRFVALRDAYAPYGGVARSDDLARLLADWTPVLVDSSLARLTIAKDIFYFQWRGAKWIPMSQFHLEDMSLNVSVRQVRRELGDQIDGWEAASWFVAKNDWLEGRRPLDVIARELPAVLQAARADRHVGLG